MKADGKAPVTVVDYGPFQLPDPPASTRRGRSPSTEIEVGSAGRFTGPDPVADKVITDADQLFDVPVKET